MKAYRYFRVFSVCKYRDSPSVLEEQSHTAVSTAHTSPSDRSQVKGHGLYGRMASGELVSKTSLYSLVSNLQVLLELLQAGGIVQFEESRLIRMAEKAEL